MFVRVVVSVYARARVCVLQSIGCGDLAVLERLMAGCLLALPPPPNPRHFLLGSSRALPIHGLERVGMVWSRAARSNSSPLCPEDKTPPTIN